MKVHTNTRISRGKWKRSRWCKIGKTIIWLPASSTWSQCDYGISITVISRREKHRSPISSIPFTKPGQVSTRYFRVPLFIPYTIQDTSTYWNHRKRKENDERVFVFPNFIELVEILQQLYLSADINIDNVDSSYRHLIIITAIYSAYEIILDSISPFAII